MSIRHMVFDDVTDLLLVPDKIHKFCSANTVESFCKSVEALQYMCLGKRKRRGL